MTAAEPVEDLYPTRSVRESVPFHAAAPVVWGTEADGPLSAGELAAFDRDGFLSFEALLGAEEILGCLEETERLGRDAGLRASGRVAPGPDADGIRSVFEVHALSEVFARVIRSSPLADVARQLLGSEVYVHQSGVSLKSAFNGSMCGWHADFETWHSEDGMAVPRALSFSVALTDNQPVNGPLMIIPGSHRTFVPAVGETPPADRTVVTELALRNGIQQLTASGKLRRPVRLQLSARLGRERLTLPAHQPLRRLQQRRQRAGPALRRPGAQARLPGGPPVHPGTPLMRSQDLAPCHQWCRAGAGAGRTPGGGRTTAEAKAPGR